MFIFDFLISKYRFKYWSRKKIETYQQSAVKNIVAFARNNTVFYKEYYKNNLTDEIDTLPYTNKNILIDNFSDANTLHLEKDEVFDFVEEIEKSRDFSKRFRGLNIGMSSGTSGNRGVEVVTPEEESFLRAIFFSRFPHDFIFGKRLNLAFVLRVSAPAFRLDFFGHSLFYVSLGDPWEKVLEQLNENQPNAISAPPSFLLRVAQAYKEHRLHFKPEFLISYAESLYPEVKEYLKETFDVPIVHEIYKATEGALATSCSHGSLHWNEDLVFVEIFDEDNSPISFNKSSYRMVITNLYKTGTPIIRYELHDIVEFSDKPCPCGSKFRVVSQIQGRADDILIAIRTDNPSETEYIYPDYVRRAIIGFDSEIIDYQAIQTSLKELVVRIKVDKKIAIDQLTKAIEAAFRRYGCIPPRIQILFESPLPHPRSLKLRRIIRDFTM